MTRCVYLEQADVAYRLGAGGKLVPASGQLCNWPDMNPGRLVDAPFLMLKLVGGGILVRPEVDCVNCPAFSADHE